MFSKAPWSAHNEDTPENDEQSLTTVLETAEDRTNLLLLIANCTESMRKTVSDTFDPAETGQPHRLPSAPTNKEEDLVSVKDSGQNAVESEAEAKEKERAERERRVTELATGEMKVLKKAALDYFDNWRDRVLERVGETVNEKHTVQNQKERAQPTKSQTVSKKLDEDSRAEASIEAMNKLYPPRDTALSKLEKPKRILILHSLLLLLLSLETYPAESRVLLLQITSSLHLPLKYLAEDETKVARGLLEAAKKQMNADDETKKKAEENSTSRNWKVGLGMLGGAALIGVTGGLAAPLLAAGFGTVMGGIGLGGTITATYLGALAGSAPLVGVLFGAYGGRMTGKMVDQYAKEVSDFAFIPTRKHSKSNNEKDLRRLRVAIGISGWLTEEGDIVQPWRVIGPGIEAFALRFELEALMSLGNSITAYVKSYAWGWAKKEIIKRTIFGALSAGLWPLGLLKIARVVDNPFSVARSRSEKAGLVLADALIHKVQEERPVTLIGYSLGARVIYSCLTSLAERKAFGLVESVVLAGAPVPSDSIAWRKMRSVVSGRLVNIFATNDYLLGFLYRTSSFQYGIAGLQAVDGVSGIENVDVSDIVSGHLRYRYLTGTILKKIGIEDIDMIEVEKEEKALKAAEAKEEEERKLNEEKAETTGHDADAEGQEMEKEVEKKNEAGMMSWVSGSMSALGITGQAHGKEQQKAGLLKQETTEDEKSKTVADQDEGLNKDLLAGKDDHKSGSKTTTAAGHAATAIDGGAQGALL